MMMKKVSLILFLIGIAFSASAQKERKLVREGNDLMINRILKRQKLNTGKLWIKRRILTRLLLI